VALGDARPNGVGFEVLGNALRPSRFAQVTAQSFGRCRWRVGLSRFSISKWGDYAYNKKLEGPIRDFVGRKNELPSDDLEEWYDEFTHLSEAGSYFFQH
jgi:hypothetical protein